MRHISVIIPAYNEEKNIIATLKVTIEYLVNKFKKDWELIVVDDGSADGTYALTGNFINASPEIRDNLKLLKNERNLGKGAAVRKGMIAAEGAIRLFMDADNSTNMREFDRIAPYFDDSSCNIVIGSRKLKSSRIIRKQPLVRRFMSLVHTLIIRLVLGVDISDINCGFKAFKADVAKKIFSSQKIDGWVFDAEILFLAGKFGYALKEVPVEWEHKDTSKVRPLGAALSSLKGIWEVKKNDLQGRYVS